jgi:hypothetical protein
MICMYCVFNGKCTGRCAPGVPAAAPMRVDAKGSDTGKITGYDNMMKRIKQSINYDFDTTIPYAPA